MVIILRWTVHCVGSSIVFNLKLTGVLCAEEISYKSFPLPKRKFWNRKATVHILPMHGREDIIGNKTLLKAFMKFFQGICIHKQWDCKIRAPRPVPEIYC